MDDTGRTWMPLNWKDGCKKLTCSRMAGLATPPKSVVYVENVSIRSDYRFGVALIAPSRYLMSGLSTMQIQRADVSYGFDVGC